MSVSLLLVVVAAVLFGCAAAGVGAGRVNLVALGLCLWSLSTVVAAGAP